MGRIANIYLALPCAAMAVCFASAKYLLVEVDDALKQPTTAGNNQVIDFERRWF